MIIGINKIGILLSESFLQLKRGRKGLEGLDIKTFDSLPEADDPFHTNSHDLFTLPKIYPKYPIHHLLRFFFFFLLISLTDLKHSQVDSNFFTLKSLCHRMIGVGVYDRRITVEILRSIHRARDFSIITYFWSSPVLGPYSDGRVSHVLVVI